jgi:hypothetical protein
MDACPAGREGAAARPTSKVYNNNTKQMNSNNDTLSVPPAVLALVDVTASEKLLLALYAAEPQARNYRALKVLGVGPSGLKKIKRRLIAKGLLRSTINGWKVLVPGLTPAPDEAGGHLVSKSDAIEKVNKVAPLTKMKPLEETLREYEDMLAFLTNQPGGTHSKTLLWLTRRALAEVESTLPDCPLKAKLVATLTTRCDAFLGLGYAHRNLPRKYHLDFDRLIFSATPEQLAKLRVGIEHAQLTGGKPTLLLAELTGKKG